MMRALVIGDRGGIGERLRSRFALTGMAHLLVISGLHLGFVAAAVFVLVRLLLGFFPALLARGWGNKMAAFAAALAVSAYASIAGHHVSTIRALVMGPAYAGAVMIAPSPALVLGLAPSALIICIALPASTADIGFQLSFAAVLAILLGMRRFTAWWRWRYKNPLAPPADRSRLNLAAEVIAGYVAVSFWAMLGTAPLTAFHFNQFSLVGLIANAVVVPIIVLGRKLRRLSRENQEWIAASSGRASEALLAAQTVLHPSVEWVAAAFGAEDWARLLSDAGIVRNRAKIEAAIANARAFLALEQEFAGRFVRIHRNALVNVRHLERIERIGASLKPRPPLRRPESESRSRWRRSPSSKRRWPRARN